MFRVTESFALSLPHLEEANVARVNEALLPAGGSAALEVKFAAIHEGVTRNYTSYSKEGLTHTNKDDQGNPGGLESWLKPTPAPIIKNHDSSNVDNIIGRVTASEWIERAGKDPGHLQLTAEITSPEAIEKFLRGEYHTGSVGLDVDTAHCSICNEDLQQAAWGGAFHEHQRGKFYKKGEKGSEFEGQFIESAKTEAGAKLAKILVGNCYGREYSMVVTPSDAKSRVKSLEVKEMTLKSKTETFNVFHAPGFTESVADPVVTDPVVTDKTDHRSVAELVNEYRTVLISDPVTYLFNLLLQKEFATYTGEYKNFHENSKLEIEEADKLIKYIFDNNEHLEEELAEITYCANASDDATIPDACFALVANKENKTLRMLPYKNKEGVIDPTALRTSLARWNVPGDVFSEADKANALRKLRAISIKAHDKLLFKDPLDVQLEKAKALLTANGLIVTSASDQTDKQKEANEKITALESQITVLQREALERDSEFDTLTEQIEDLNTELQTSSNNLKATIIESILTIQGLDEATREAKMTELLALEVPVLETQLTEATTEQVTLWKSARVPKSGLGIEDEVEQDNSVTQNSGTVLAALLGDKKARTEVANLMRRLPK